MRKIISKTISAMLSGILLISFPAVTAAQIIPAANNNNFVRVEVPGQSQFTLCKVKNYKLIELNLGIDFLQNQIDSKQLEIEVLEQELADISFEIQYLEREKRELQIALTILDLQLIGNNIEIAAEILDLETRLTMINAQLRELRREYNLTENLLEIAVDTKIGLEILLERYTTRLEQLEKELEDADCKLF